MTGPAYPAVDSPLAGAIGTFVIGSSAIGPGRDFDVWQTIISQYANSPRLTQLITDFQDYVDQTSNLDNFFNLIWNVDTAVGYGLDVWARIVAINRVLKVGAGPTYFGYDEGYPDWEPFNSAPFYSGQKLTTNYIMPDDGFRVMILAKAFSNICDGSISSINRLLRMLFGQSGKCYVVDGLDMTMQYKFEFPLTPVQAAILTQSGVFPRPTGVLATIDSLT